MKCEKHAVDFYRSCPVCDYRENYRFNGLPVNGFDDGYAGKECTSKDPLYISAWKDGEKTRIEVKKSSKVS